MTPSGREPRRIAAEEADGSRDRDAAVPAISVIVSACAKTRIEDLRELLEALTTQGRDVNGQLDVTIVVDRDEDLLRETLALDAIARVRIVFNPEDRGLAHSRNAGLRVSTGAIVAFVDDDAVPEPGFAQGLLAAFADPEVVAVAGRISPRFAEEGMEWFPRDLYWMISCTFGDAATRRDIRNGFGANMAFRRSVFDEVGGFEERLGLKPGQWIGGEDTEFFLRIHAAGLGRVVYEPAVHVRHKIPASRLGLRSLRRRAFDAGRSMALTRKIARTRARSTYLREERSYLRTLLTKALLRGFANALQKSREIRQPFVILMTVLFAGLGYLDGTWTRFDSTKPHPRSIPRQARTASGLGGR